ncbi:MAG TPA: bifunctional 4-hydroxy-2-oxoglutarate aldolase/2-dehydro-3-deoxy-phosphogluconate aldolase [Candidatus Binatia bacterium]|nr:bifunctional 4-hydroxy-2-oxoglutarate aldolase/2-dehydro-3-deoxy-phosphogluconate aldolase [Candidatus Binatia bacterium]
MRSHLEIISQLTRPGIIAVVRTDQPEQVPPICQALLAGRVIAIEITLTVPNALQAIREATRQFGAKALIGAGTVLNAEAGRAAIAAGAEFIVSPISRPEIVEAAHGAGRPAMLGAYTPTEAQTAHEAGADFIKIFPADRLGPAYIRALRAPLPHLWMVPTGGVDLQNAADYLKAGCAALGVGGSLVTNEILRTNNWPELTRLAEAFVEIADRYLASRFEGSRQ